MKRFGSLFRTLVDFLREVLGEKAYARHCDYMRAHGGEPMTPEEFYLWQLRRKYSQPHRCC